MITTPDKDAGFVNTKKKNDEFLKFGAICIGYEYSSEYKTMEFTDECIKFFIKEGMGWIGARLEKEYISKIWYNSSANVFGLTYSNSIAPVQDIDSHPKWGVCFKPKTKFSVSNFNNFFEPYGEITAERPTTTDIACNIPGEKFTPCEFVNRVREEKQLLTPKKNKKIIKNDSENELSEDEVNNIETISHKKDLKSLKEEKRKIEEKVTDNSPEKPPTKKIKKVVEKTKQELSSSDSEDISDTDIVTKHHVTRSKTKSARANLDLDKVVLSKYSIQITLRDISRLEPDEFLNDNIIDFYLR